MCCAAYRHRANGRNASRVGALTESLAIVPQVVARSLETVLGGRLRLIVLGALTDQVFGRSWRVPVGCEPENTGLRLGGRSPAVQPRPTPLTD